ncbi:MAG: NAD-dependent epimerase/dehydratase family protein, partial [Chloroflexi bacterium]|nr:NAD-dependent epimerase/dehydratase family protein [Chloroflexota bacterium]
KGAELSGARLVFVSSGGAIYGEADGATEASRPAPISPYGRSKLAAERVVGESGLSYGIARLSNVYGPRQRSDQEGGVVAIFVTRLLAGAPVEVHGTGSQRRDFVYIDDVTSALLAIGTAQLDGMWNVGSGNATTILELLELVGAATGSAADIHIAPRRLGDIEVSRLSIDRIKSDLGWLPRTDLPTGLARTVAAFRGTSSK